MSTELEKTCIVCKTEAAALGVMCETCRDEIAASRGLLPQQIISSCARPTGDVLVDQWGRAHPLEDRTLIGRVSDGLLVLEASVSRHHAHLAKGEGGWMLRDLASANGTFVNDESIEARMLRHGDRIAVGSVGFYLALDVGESVAPPLEPAAIETMRSRTFTLPDLDTTGIEMPSVGRVDTVEPGLPTLDVRIIESSSGAGGVLQVGNVSTQLSPNQTRLVALLAQRMLDEVDQPMLVRGFVRSSELLGTLTWDSADPDENVLKQLVRRTRRQLERAGIGDVIEARQRFGYRLRVVPR